MSVSRETAETARDAHERVVSRETADTGRLTSIVLLPLRGYRRYLSPAFRPRCRYYPSCSAYAEEAIREVGAVRGTILAAWRLLRCNPFSKGGIDPVAGRPFFRPTHTHERTKKTA